MSEKSTKALTSKERKQELLTTALGKVGVLCVGVTDYLPTAGFPKLKKCANDAMQVQLAFRETPQLNADPAFIRHLTSEMTGTPPSKGLIIHHLKELAAGAKADDRILFYFSGHGHRIPGNDDFFLVPQDAYDDSDPAALLSLKQVTDILLESYAKQKIVILDACLSGPTLLGKKLKVAVSDKFLAEYMQKTKGVAFLSSSEPDQASYEKSNHPKLSLFTSILVPALRGEADALDGHFLTLPSLFDYVSVEVQRAAISLHLRQVPTLQDTSTGVIVLGDFRAFLIPSGPVDFKKHPITSLVLKDSQGESTSSILTSWRDRRLTVEQLEYAANRALAEYLEADFGRFRSSLRKQLGFSASEIDSEDERLIFPGGTLSYTFKGETKDSGLLLRELSLDADWFDKPERLKSLMKILDFDCDEFVWELGVTLEPLKQIASLEAKGWESISETKSVVKFRKTGVKMTVEARRITFEGLNVLGMLEAGAESNSVAALVGDTLQLLPAKASK